jgi:hypothetical protein
VFFTITNVLLEAFPVGLMPQEMALTPVHLVRDASNFKAFHHHILWNRSQGFKNPLAHFCQCGPYNATCQQCLMCFLHSITLWMSNLQFLKPIDWVVWLQHPGHVSWCDYQVTPLSLHLGLHTFWGFGSINCLKSARTAGITVHLVTETIQI